MSGYACDKLVCVYSEASGNGLGSYIVRPDDGFIVCVGGTGLGSSGIYWLTSKVKIIS